MKIHPAKARNATGLHRREGSRPVGNSRNMNGMAPRDAVPIQLCNHAAADASGSEPGALPEASAAAWLQSWIGTASLGAIPFMFLLFPTGRLPSRRWRPVAFLAFAGWIFIALGTLLRPGGYERTISGVSVPGTNATSI